MTNEKFSLRTILREATAHLDSVSTAEAVALVLKRLRPDQYREALKQALTTYVVNFITNDTRRVQIRNLRREHTRWTSTKEDADSGALDVFRMRVNVDGRYMFLSDCTQADLQVLIDEYTLRIDRTQRWLDVYAALQKSLANKKAKRVADLQDKDVWAAFQPLLEE